MEGWKERKEEKEMDKETSRIPITQYAIRNTHHASRITHHVSRFTFHASRFTPKPAINESGFTLVELLIAVSILIVISGAAYTAFNIATDVYQKSESRIVMAQKCRTALDRIVTDLSNMQAVQGDTSLTLVSQDNPGEEGEERDVISFVTLIQTDPDPFLAQLNPEGQSRTTDEENQQTLVSDVQRVAYYIGPDPSQQAAGSETRGTMFPADSEANQEMVLLRIATTELDPEKVIQPLLETGQVPTEDEEGNPIRMDIVPIIDGIVSFDLKYFDGETWYDSWENTETIPKSVQILITVAAEDSDPKSQNVKPNTLTQSTMVYLLMSANFSEQTAGGGPAGVPGG